MRALQSQIFKGWAQLIICYQFFQLTVINFNYFNINLQG